MNALVRAGDGGAHGFCVPIFAGMSMVDFSRRNSFFSMCA